MDHFLWAFNPQKKVPPTGLQGYIIDTVKGCWLRVEIFKQKGTRVQKHLLTMIAGTGDNMLDRQSAHRASRWYNAWLIVRKIKEADIEVVLPSYSGDEPAPVTRVEYVVEENANKVVEPIPSSEEGGIEGGSLYDPPHLAPIRKLTEKLKSNNQ